VLFERPDPLPHRASRRTRCQVPGRELTTMKIALLGTGLGQAHAAVYASRADVDEVIVFGRPPHTLAQVRNPVPAKLNQALDPTASSSRDCSPGARPPSVPRNSPRLFTSRPQSPKRLPGLPRAVRARTCVLPPPTTRIARQDLGRDERGRTHRCSYTNSLWIAGRIPWPQVTHASDDWWMLVRLLLYSVGCSRPRVWPGRRAVTVPCSCSTAAQ
jgi:hypothetical protein